MGTTWAEVPPDARWPAAAAALWRGRWIVAATTVAGALLGSQAGALLGETWTAQVRMVLAVDQAFTPLGGSRPDPERFTATRSALVVSGPVLERAVDLLDDGTGIGDLVQAATATPDEDRDVVTITTTGPTAGTAAARADAMAQAYREFSLEQVERTADVTARAVAGNTAAVADIRALAGVYGDGVELVEAAVVPDAPTSPRPLRDAAALGSVGLLVGAGVAVARGPRRRGTDDAAGALGAPILADVTLPERRGRYAAPSPQDVALAVVALVEFLDARPGPVMIMGLGRPAASAAVVDGLARGLAPRRVAVVDVVPGCSYPEPVDAPDGAASVARIALEAGTSLAELGTEHDVVLVCAGPAGRDAGALRLLPETAGVVVVAAPAGGGTTEVDALRRGLALAGRRCDGVIAVHRRPAG
ncbi:hypothetical protein [Blastococcus tunisiensis]|uniref:Capsular polysaccharide biosynthesis protein n=1 Tax=Blastococcus tunisiensis TaxID=1798228 RepID=A0A1I1X9S3_9ACTN|nr:hypothetical protein [Blastococcus sp. DSM 46838]SFE04166.1 hypothetical protein SAMN05216574_1025 [Blastococcus sp. DSM 46838]